MKPIGIVRFPGTNCDQDTWKAVHDVGLKPQWLWHEDRFDPKSVDAVIVAGGFSFGDYLRTGALAGLSSVMQSVHEAAKLGTPILGICNGFQILCETKLLPGVLLRNESLRFVDEWTPLEKGGEKFQLPIAHGEGRFYADEKTLNQLEDQNQIWIRYAKNPNGSLRNIAGVLNEKKNVAGLMPHPERAMHTWTGGTAGRKFIETLTGGFK